MLEVTDDDPFVEIEENGLQVPLLCLEAGRRLTHRAGGLRFRFLEPQARFRPYVLGGVTYAHFYGERGSATLNGLNPINPPGGTQLNVDSRWGWSLGLGVTASLTERWFVDLHYARTWLKTTTTLSSGQRIDTRLDPDVWTLSVGYRF